MVHALFVWEFRLPVMGFFLFVLICCCVSLVPRTPSLPGNVAVSQAHAYDNNAFFQEITVSSQEFTLQCKRASRRLHTRAQPSCLLLKEHIPPRGLESGFLSFVVLLFCPTTHKVLSSAENDPFPLLVLS